MSKMSRKLKIASLTIVIGLVLTLAFAVCFGATPVRKADAAGFATRYTSDYASKDEAIEAGARLNERIAEEGAVLLKNNKVGGVPALPLDPGGVGSDASGVTLFGYKSVRPESGASVNDTDASAGVTIATSDIYTSLAMAGYRTNPVTKAAYENWIGEDTVGKLAFEADPANKDKTYTATRTCDYAAKTTADPTGIKKFTEDVDYSFADYSDAAVVVLSATGVASKNDGRTLVDTAAGVHSRQLDTVQKALLTYVKAQKDAGVFDRLIVLINDSTPFELKEIDDMADAVLLIGNSGASGLNAVGRLLSGEVNPSGKLADVYPVDFTKDPTFDNFGRNSIEPVTELIPGAPPTLFGPATRTTRAGGDQYVDQNGTPLAAYFTDYEEGIYVGYRYYETMAEQLKATDADWYDENVVYSFGEGLSYSTFKWNPNFDKVPAKVTSADQKISVSVGVENTGRYGKDVVELYYSAPYTTTAKLEKPAVVLGDFAKTSGGSVTLSLKARDMASYDVNANGGKGAYVLEAGTYTLSLRTDSHTVKTNANDTTTVFTKTFEVENDIVITESDQTGETISNAFDHEYAGLSAKDSRADSVRHPGAKGFKELSRDDMKADGSHLPQRRSLYNFDADDGVLTGTDVNASANNVLTRTDAKDEFADWNVNVDNTKDTDKNGISDYDEGKPWAVAKEKMPKYADAKTRPAKAAVVLSDLIGKGYDDPLWETLLDQLTIDEMADMVNTGGFMSMAIPYIGKPETLDTDSPLGWSGRGTAGAMLTKYATAPVIACTWNKELAYEMGKMMGDQGLWGRSDTGTAVKAYTGWYGPGMNTHRSPFLSRYTEYYSEDGYLAGMMAANATLGAKEKGCYSFIKHFAAHEDGGTDRGIISGATGSATSGLSIWMSEQAMREIYLKPFQIAVEKGSATAAMSSFSRFGPTWAGASYGLLTQVLRGEWGFEGMVVTDIAIYDFVNAEQMIRAGGDLILSSGFLDEDVYKVDRKNLTATNVTALRNTAKHVLYTVANSNAMQIPLGAAISYTGKALDAATVGKDYAGSIATAVLNTVYSYDGKISYEITDGFLPDGLSLDAGEVYGKPTRAGEFTFTVKATAGGFAPATATFTVAVDTDKTTADIIGGATDGLKTDLDGKIDGAVTDLNGKIEATNEKVDGVNSVVIIALVFGIIGALGAVAATVLLILKRK